MIPLDVRLQNFLGAVSFVADEDLHRAVWIEKQQGLTSVTSIGEFFCQFFDDNDMDGFVGYELATAPISENKKVAIMQFCQKLAPIERLPSYHDEEDAKTLQTKEWKELVDCAKHTLRQFAVEA